MKESYSARLANHTGPESCTVSCEGIGEALTGEMRAGELNRENPETTGRRRAWQHTEGNSPCTEYREVQGSPARS